MKNNEIRNLKNLTKKQEKKHKKIVNWNWIIKISILAFIISLIFSAASELAIPNVNIIIGIILVILFIFIGVIFDIVGVAVTSADEKVFHSMSARKVKGATLAVTFKKNAEKVSSFCNDVIGDICGIISGSAGAIISATLATKLNCNALIISLIVTAFVASLTIGGKALGKSYAINKSNIILFRFAKIISFFYKKRWECYMKKLTNRVFLYNIFLKKEGF